MSELKKASNNIFEDLGFSGEEAAVLKIKADLRVSLEKELAARKLSQVEAAKILGVSRPRLNRLLKGKLDGISIDKLVAMHDRIGKRVSVRVSRGRHAA